MTAERHVSIFRNGRNQAIRIPREFELAGTEAIIRKEGDRLIIEPAPPRNRLLALLAGGDALDVDFPASADPPLAAEDLLWRDAFPARHQHPFRSDSQSARAGCATSGRGRCRGGLHQHRGGVQIALWRGETRIADAHAAEALLDCVPLLPFEAEADRHYADIRTALESAGQCIGGNDLLIAAHGQALDATLVTHNRREFERVPGLRVVDWLER